jgi:hypothetical protein
MASWSPDCPPRSCDDFPGPCDIGKQRLNEIGVD